VSTMHKGYDALMESPFFKPEPWFFVLCVATGATEYRNFYICHNLYSFNWPTSK